MHAQSTQYPWCLQPTNIQSGPGLGQYGMQPQMVDPKMQAQPTQYSWNPHQANVESRFGQHGVQLQVVDHNNPYSRTIRPLPGSLYTPRLQCLLMDFLGRTLHYEADHVPPPGFFLPEKMVEQMIYHRSFEQTDPYLYQLGINSLPGLKRVDLSIYINKDRDGMFGVRGRKYYRITSFAIAFNSANKCIVGPREDLCRGMLAFQWHNHKELDVSDWDHMPFEEVLRLLRRVAMRNFDEHGNPRTEEERLLIDESLGNMFPTRGKHFAPLAETDLRVFPRNPNYNGQDPFEERLRMGNKAKNI